MALPRKPTPVNTRSMSLRPALCIAFSLPGSSGAGAFVNVNLETLVGFFFAYSSNASCVSARSPATSTTLMLTGPLGNAGTWASASGKLPMHISAAAAASATVILSASLRALKIRRLNLNLCMHPPCWLAVCAALRPANSISSYYPEARLASLSASIATSACRPNDGSTTILRSRER